MSIGIQSLIWKAGPASKAEMLLLLAIADHATDEGYAFPGVALLAKKSRDTARNVLRVLPKLVTGGWLSVTPRGRSNDFQISLSKLIPLAIANSDNLSHEERRIVALYSDKMSHVEAVAKPIGDIAVEQQVTLRDGIGDITGSLYRVTIKEPSLEPQPVSVSSQKSAKTIPRPTLAKVTDEDLAPLWAAYPRKVGSKTEGFNAMRKAIARLHAGEEDKPKLTSSEAIALLLESIKAFALTTAKQGTETRFIAHPATWFNKSRYLVETLPAQSASASSRRYADPAALYSGSEYADAPSTPPTSRHTPTEAAA